LAAQVGVDEQTDEKTLMPALVPARWIEEQIALAVDDVAVLIRFPAAGTMRMLTDHHARALLDEKTARLPLPRRGKRIMLNPAMEQNDQEIIVASRPLYRSHDVNRIQRIGPRAVIGSDRPFLLGDGQQTDPQVPRVDYQDSSSFFTIPTCAKG